MNCRMGRGVYLRANGEINCYCSTGEQISLATLPRELQGWDFVKDVYLQGRFRHLRDSLAADRLPFPDQCLKCNYLDPAGTFSEALVDREIEWMHLEAAAMCNLACPYCVHGIKADRRVYARGGPRLLDEALHAKVLEDIRAAGMGVRWMYFSGRGEPGLHPGLWRMVKRAKRLFQTNFLVNTNGNIPFSKEIVESGLDKIKIALDSLDQETYARYRVGGEVDRVLGLTRDIVECKRRLGSKTPSVIWQTVLQHYNDSRDALAGYQQAALAHGVDSVRVVYTFTRDHGASTPETLPRIFPNIEILDCKERDDMPIGILRQRRAEAVAAQTLEGHIQVASNILHWFQMGMPDRDAYDAFARCGLADPSAYAGRDGHPLRRAYLEVLRDTLRDVQRFYAARGDAASATWYRTLLQGPGVFQEMACPDKAGT